MAEDTECLIQNDLLDAALPDGEHVEKSAVKCKNMACTGKRKVTALGVSGVVMTCIGIAMFFVFPLIMKNEIKKKLVLKEGTIGYKNWKNIPVPIYLSFYMFNVVNIDEVYQKKKPVLQEMGPYTFREERIKVVLSANKNGTITYKQVRKWYFDEKKSNGSLDDVVTSLNVPMVAAAAKAKQANSVKMFLGLNFLFGLLHTKWFVRKPVRQLLFEGYSDVLVTLGKEFYHIPYDKFGWFYQRNGTDDGIINILTGENGIETIDNIYTWKDQKKTTSYDLPCGSVTGSGGDMWPPFLTRDSFITMFIPDICRSISFTFMDDVHLLGILAHRYYADQTQLDNGKYDFRHKCFCYKDDCLPAGAVNVSVCKFDAPAVVSYPHFLYGDPYYHLGVEGMHPDPEKHLMYLDIVPDLGVPLRVAARMQINIIFDKVPEIYQFRNISERIYWPMFWFTTDAVMDEDVASQFKPIVKTLPIVFLVISIVTVSIGIILSITALIMCRPWTYKLTKKEQPGYSSVQSE